ncbi:helix-turn-helix domain-containing protein [Nocardia aurantiaca]|nr:helix-turn-helix domain-containing protein [Nocardia aurantiaca]
MTSGKAPRAQVGERANTEPAVTEVSEPVVAEVGDMALAQASTPVAAAGVPDIKALAERVKARRRENGWTQADVARQGGPSAGSVSQIERCLIEAPVRDMLNKLDVGLGWPPGTAADILRGASSELVGAAL